MITIIVRGKQGEGKSNLIHDLVAALIATGRAAIVEDDGGTQYSGFPPTKGEAVKVVAKQAPSRSGKGVV